MEWCPYLPKVPSDVDGTLPVQARERWVTPVLPCFSGASPRYLQQVPRHIEHDMEHQIIQRYHHIIDNGHPQILTDQPGKFPFWQYSKSWPRNWEIELSDVFQGLLLRFSSRMPDLILHQLS